MPTGKIWVRQHNDSNVVVFGVDCLGVKLTANLAMDYLRSGFDGEAKNKLRLGKIRDMEGEFCKAA